MKTIATLIAAAALVPAVAVAAPKPAASVESPASEGAPAAKAEPRRYCVKTASMTGSRIERKECRSLDAWLARGFDPRAQ